MNLEPALHTRLLSLHRRRGMTLIEMMVVLVIVAGLLALMVGPLAGVMEANRLTESGQSLAFRISMARQMALTDNHPVEMRFYIHDDDNGAHGVHATQLFALDDETDNGTRPLEGAVALATGIYIPETALSPLFGGGGNGAAPPAIPADVEPFKSMEAQYRKVVFYPNGATSITQPLRQAYVTLCSTRADASDPETPPLNYFTIQIDPINGTSKTYRPN